MASFVAGSFVHNAAGLTATLGAAVQVGDVIIVTVGGNTSAATAVADNLASGGNVYTLQQNGPDINNGRPTTWTAPVTQAGTPLITVTDTGTGVAISAWAHRGLSSATPHMKGENGDNSANPLTVNKTTTVQCTVIITWWNQGSGGTFLSFTPAATQLNSDTTDFDRNAYITGQPPGIYTVGANFTSGDPNDEVIVLWLPENPTVGTYNIFVSGVNLAYVNLGVQHTLLGGISSVATTYTPGQITIQNNNLVYCDDSGVSRLVCGAIQGVSKYTPGCLRIVGINIYWTGIDGNEYAAIDRVS